MVSCPGTCPTTTSAAHRAPPEPQPATPRGHGACTMRGVRNLGLLLGLLVVLLSAPARAETSADRQAARRYFEAGNAAYSAGQYALAARAFEEAQRLAPLPEITFSTAQAYRLAYYQDRRPELLRRALELYRRYLKEAPSGRRRSHATLHIEAIEGLLGGPVESPTIEPLPRPAPATELMVTSKTPGARGRIDGGEWLELPFSKSVSPGKHRVTVDAPGHDPADREWLVVAGRLVVADTLLEPRPALLRVVAPAGAEVVIDEQVVGTAPLLRPISVSPGKHRVRVSLRGHRPWARSERVERGQTVTVRAERLGVTDQRVVASWMLGGAAVLGTAALGTGLFALAAERRVQRYDDSRAEGPKTASQLQQRNDDLKTRDDFRTATYLLLGAAVAAGTTGAVLWWVDTPSAEPKTVGVQPWVGRDMLGVGWAGRYQ